MARSSTYSRQEVAFALASQHRRSAASVGSHSELMIEPTGTAPKSFRYQAQRGHVDIGRRTNIALEHIEEQLLLPEWEQSSGFRHKVGELIYSQKFDMLIGFVVILNFITITLETDGRCTLAGNPSDTEIYKKTERMMQNIGYLNLAFLFVYIMECSARFYVQRFGFFKSGWNLFDFGIVLCGIVGEVMERIVQEGSSTESMGVLRTMRMVRLLRVSRILISFQELYALISGLVNCMKTLMWAAGLVFLSLTIWSIIAVEYMHPLMADLDEAGHYTYCSWCPYAFNGIMNANLTFFQIISGDGWSNLARALIEEHPWTAVVFVAVIFTMVFGLLNLVTAVIVDTAVRAREQDHASLALQQDEEKTRLWVRFNKICKDLDKDESGYLSLEELQEGFHEVPELRQFFTILGVEEEDLVTIFKLIDTDLNGHLTFDEFSGELQKLKTNHTQFTVYYIKRLAEDLHRLMLNLQPENSGQTGSPPSPKGKRASKRSSAASSTRSSTDSANTRRSTASAGASLPSSILKKASNPDSDPLPPGEKIGNNAHPLSEVPAIQKLEPGESQVPEVLSPEPSPEPGKPDPMSPAISLQFQGAKRQSEIMGLSAESQNGRLEPSAMAESDVGSEPPIAGKADLDELASKIMGQFDITNEKIEIFRDKVDGLMEKIQMDRIVASQIVPTRQSAAANMDFYSIRSRRCGVCTAEDGSTMNKSSELIVSGEVADPALMHVT